MTVRTFLIRLVTFLGGLYFFLKFMLPKETGFTDYHSQIADGFVLVGAMALGLGLINLLMVHGTRVLYLRKGWAPSIALLFGLFFMLAVTTLDWIATRDLSFDVQKISLIKDFSERIVQDARNGFEPKHTNGERLTPSVRNTYLGKSVEDILNLVEVEREKIALVVFEKGDEAAKLIFERANRELLEAAHSLRQANATLQLGQGEFDPSANLEIARSAGHLSAAYRGMKNAEYSASLLRKIYMLLFNGLFISLGSAMFSLLGFYICAAAYRAFRFKSMESLLMMAAALLVMLGQIPFGFWISEALPEIRLWLLQVPSAAAARAIEMGAVVAGLIMAFRMWLSIESESFK